MYHKIVVAYDGTVAGDAALLRGADIARLCHAELFVLGVVVSSGGLLLDPAIVPLELLETERAALNGAMQDAIVALGPQALSVQTAIRDGEVVREIIAFVEAIRADLVVVGHSHKGVMARWFEGSVGTRLLDAMPCSVLIAVSTAAG